jgi:ATP-binding cassette subfamily B protein
VRSIGSKSAALISAHIVQYVLWLASWVILARISAASGAGRVWLFAWAATLLALIPFRVLGTWLQGLISIDIGGFLKTRLLCGALQLNPEDFRHCGLGAFLSQALESETVETLAVTGGMAGLLAITEIVVAAFILGRFAPVLLLWCAVTALLAAVFFIRYQSWTETRMAMTHDLIELMAGHRTRLAQQPPHRRHEGEAEALENYSHLSRRLDGAGALLLAAIPRGWLLVGIASLAPVIATHKDATSAMAIALGGVLLAYTAFKRLAGSLAELAAAFTAWKRIAPLLGAPPEKTPPGKAAAARIGCPTRLQERLLEIQGVKFRYQDHAAPALRSCDLVVNNGDRILLEGPSGGGKTTLGSLLAGLREPQSGLLLLNGLDIHTLGAQHWREHVAAAPQFHENYIVTETLAFNLLMGRHWPPARADMQEAQAICRELGLGDLLNRMPAGLLEMVGEGGWQLSHGERSRIYIARALLQRAELVILDESFAALDPETLNTALECALRRAKTLIVVAHP